ncbi:ras GEF [Wallemia mellicola]|nr:ras GEF [Wallemia mellicola]
MEIAIGIAVHDFEPLERDPSILSFKRNDIVHILNKDASGWWDCEVNGVRGWLPMNYVTEDIDAFYDNSEDEQDHSADEQDEEDIKDTLDKALEEQNQPHKESPIVAVRNALTLVKSAVISSRLAHLQPATACVISSVRALLSAADALNKDSSSNKISASIADNRRNLLSLLSRLVVQSRLVMKEALQSSNKVILNEDLEEVIPMADQVLVLAENFVKLCESYGINLVEDITPHSSPHMSQLSQLSPKSQRSMSSNNNQKSLMHRQASRLSRMTSYDSFKSSAAQSVASSAASLVLNNSHDWADSSNEDHLEDQSSSDQTFSRLLCVINDALKSTIAAALGHIHAMPNENHATASIHLIDLLKETIAIVKRLLTVLQSIQQNGPLNTVVPRDGMMLDETIRLTYLSTDDLVAAAESLLFAKPRRSMIDTTQESKRHHLLKCIMQIHKISTEAFEISSRMIEYASTASIPLSLNASIPSQQSTFSLQDITNNGCNQPIPEPALQPRENQTEFKRQHRRQQTLSLFDRRAASLTCLKDQFQGNTDYNEEVEDVKETLTTPTMKDKFDQDIENNRPESRASQATTVYAPHIKFTSTDNLNTPTQTEHLKNLSPVSATFTEKDSSQRSSTGGSPNTLTMPLNSPETGKVSPMPESPVGIALPLNQDGHKGHAVGGKTPSLSSAAGSFDLSVLRPRIRARAATVGTADVYQDKDNKENDQDSTALKLSFGGNKPSISSIQRDDMSIASMTSGSELNGSAMSMRSNTDDGFGKAGTSTPATVHSWVLDEKSPIKEKPKFELGDETESENEDVDSLPPLPVTQVRARQRQRAFTTSATQSPIKSSFDNELKPTVNFGKYEIVRGGPNDKIMGATLPSLVELLTPHDTTLDVNVLETFMMTFRLFTSPKQLAIELRNRFEKADDIEDKTISDPIRLRIFNLAKLWLEVHWQDREDYSALEAIEYLGITANTMSTFNASADVLLKLTDKRRYEHENMTSANQNAHSYNSISKQTKSKRQAGQNSLKSFINYQFTESNSSIKNRNSRSSMGSTTDQAPIPQISRSLLNHLKSPQGLTSAPLPTDFEPIEMARQLTIMESRLYQCVTVDELLSVNEGGSTKKGVDVHVVRPALKAMSEFTTRVTSWVSESILREDEARRRVPPIKFWIKVCKHSLSLNNYGLLIAIVCGLTTSTIGRLKRTWELVPVKHRNLLNNLNTLAACDRNYAVYRARLRSTQLPALPYVGLFLSDLTFVHVGNKPTRPSMVDSRRQVINFDKYEKLKNIIKEISKTLWLTKTQEFMKFQEPFRLTEITEFQTYLHRALTHIEASNESAQDLYNRSCALEPKNSNLGMQKVKGNASVESLRHSVDRKELFGWTRRH